MKKLFSFILASCVAAAAQGAGIDYTKGVFIVNEDWYGHQNSTMNYILPDDPDGDYWHYRVIQAENPGKELGCTNQFGAIWNGRFYLIAKQDKDGGALVTGGRITVADATTLKIVKQLQYIASDGSQCDGRGFVGVSDTKGYVSSSNGVWVLDLDKIEIVKKVAGSENPNGSDGKPNTDSSGSLYHGQCGTMVLAAGRVFAAHQSEGLLVIDPATDAVTDVIKMDVVQPDAGIGAVVLGADGNLWVSVAGGTDGRGSALPYLLKVDPVSLSCTVVPLPDGTYGPSNSWYAWTPDAFCASETQPVLYWKGGANTWFSGKYVYRYDIETGTCTRIINLEDEDVDWKIYGCSMRVHPQTEEIYMSVYHDFTDPTYALRRYDEFGNLIKEYPMISNYWFPSLPVFPQSKYTTGISLPVAGDSDAPAEYFDLQGRRIDVGSARPGIYIERRGRTARKIVLK